MQAISVWVVVEKQMLTWHFKCISNRVFKTKINAFSLNINYIQIKGLQIYKVKNRGPQFRLPGCQWQVIFLKTWMSLLIPFSRGWSSRDWNHLREKEAFPEYDYRNGFTVLLLLAGLGFVGRGWRWRRLCGPQKRFPEVMWGPEREGFPAT